MSASRSKLEDELGKYVSDTFSCIKTIKHFVSGSLKWIEEKEEEKCTLAKIPEKLNEIHNSNNYNIIPAIASRQRAEDVEKLQTELEDLIQKILKGLREIQTFLEAVEKLAVTSEPVFDQNHVLQLEIFKAKLHNVEVMENQMNQYIRLIKNFCNAFKECSVADLSLTRPTLVLKPDLSEDDVEKVLRNINILQQIRNNIHFRLVVLFGDEYKTFMEKFSEKEERMHEFLNDLEPCAVQLDSINKGARISNVVSSSVGVVGGGLSIAGLVLAPFTAGASLILTIGGAAAAGTSVATSVVTMITGKAASSTQKNKANETLQNFMNDVNDLQKCLKEAIIQHIQNSENNDFQAAVNLAKNGASVTKSINVITDCFPLYKLAQAENALIKAASSGKVMSRAVSDLPELGQVAFKGPLAMGNESMSLLQGSETEISKWIRARADLWRSEVNSLQEINDSLEKGQKMMDEKQVLQNPFCGLSCLIPRPLHWLQFLRPEHPHSKPRPGPPPSLYIPAAPPCLSPPGPTLPVASKQKAKDVEKLQTELEDLIPKILKGLEQIQEFLEAVEKLAVTSEPVLTRTTFYSWVIKLIWSQ
ncbi:hypothetical protein WMY93_027073 [Mugilogobius chulae]|uniref:Uncharacterized protein n=1 Tax=Mugilogobius chulae TaxID=88201 RepID=A0AAW0MW12_9GOBI